MNKTDIQAIEKEADKMAVREYLSHGIYGGASRSSGGVVVSHKYFDFEDAKRRAIVYLEKIGFKVKKG